MKPILLNLPGLKSLSCILLLSSYVQAQNIPNNSKPSIGIVTPFLPPNFTAGIKINYARTTVPTIPVTAESAIQPTDPNQSRVSTQYLDGLGRPIQKVDHFASPQANDIVTLVKYDALGREAFHFLPYSKGEPSTNDNGKFKLTAFSDQKKFYKATLNYANDFYFYTQTRYEASPLNRIVKTLPQGNTWIGMDRGKTIAENPLPAGANIRLFTIGYAPGSLPVTTGVYTTADLMVKTMTDEDGYFTEEYTSKDNHVVLKTNGKTGNAVKLQTYYVYDDFGMLRYTIPPKATTWLAANNWTLNATVVAELCFSYEYDGRLRPIVKTTPGAGAEWMVYNLKDELVFTQTPTQRAKGEWVFNKYDVLGRLIQAGIYYNTANQAAMHNYVNSPYTGTDPLLQYLLKDIYGNAAYTNIFTTAKVYTTNYYDDYSFTTKIYDASFMNGLPVGWNTVISKETTNLLTGTKTILMDGASTPTELLSINYYNDRGLLLQTQMQNHKGGWNIITSSYDFLGQKLGTYTELNNPQATDNAKIKTVEEYTYDHAGRLLSNYHSLNDQPSKASPLNTYDDAGRLTGKTFDKSESPAVLYDYNVRGWLTGINKDYCWNFTGNLIFGMELNYDYGYTTNYLNGNIAGIKWRNSGKLIELRSYGYTYDAYNRLKSGDFVLKLRELGSNYSWFNTVKDYTASNMLYDENGNLQSMKQMGLDLAGQKIILDDLLYGYNTNSNKLKSVTESASSQSKNPTIYDNLGDFRDVPGTADYTYDANGNLLTDANKSLSFTYDEIINKTKRVSKGAQNVDYLYDASGNKLQKKVSSGSTTTITDYIGAAVYTNNSLNFIVQPEGRIRYNATAATKYMYDYYIKDHLGSTRAVVTYTNGSIAGFNKSEGGSAEEVIYIATSEPENATKENQLFDNVDNTRAAKPKNKTATDNYVVRISSKNNKTILGPDITLKVMAGDTIKVSAEALYIAEKNNPNKVVKNVINNFITAFTALPTMATEGANALTNSNNQALANAIVNMQQATAANGEPKAFLNYILYDEYMNLIPRGSGALQIKNKEGWQTLETEKMAIPQNGFIRVFSNNMEAAPISINNTTLAIIPGKLVEEYNYYPYGLVFDQTQALPSITKTNYLYNGKELQHNEFGAGNGLELCDFDNRAYDSQTGRFNQVDILGEQRNNLSPYNYCSNNPVNRTDPTGMLDGWYKDDKDQPVFDANINSQADMYEAGISGTFIGQEAMVFDNTDNIMKWGNKDGSLGGINLPEVAVSEERGNSSNVSSKLNTANDVLNYAGYSQAGIGALQIGMIQYRQAQPILDKIGNFSEFSSAYRTLGVASKILGGASTYIGAPLSIAINYRSMQSGEIGVGKFAYRTIGLGASIATGTAIGGPWGAIGGAVVGGSIWAGEESYNGFQFWLKEMSKGISNFENAINSNWTPR